MDSCFFVCKGGFMTPIASTMTNTIVRRPSTNCSKPPPPPIRRNSSITAATPNAPAVDFVRTNSRCTTPGKVLTTLVGHLQ